MLLLSIITRHRGSHAPLKFSVAMTGPNPEEAQNVVEQVVSQVQGLMPESLRLAATMVQLEQGKTAQSLVLD